MAPRCNSRRGIGGLTRGDTVCIQSVDGPILNSTRLWMTSKCSCRCMRSLTDDRYGSWCMSLAGARKTDWSLSVKYFGHEIRPGDRYGNRHAPESERATMSGRRQLYGNDGWSDTTKLRYIPILLWYFSFTIPWNYSDTTLILLRYYSDTTSILLRYYSDTTTLLFQYFQLPIRYYFVTIPILLRYYPDTIAIQLRYYSDTTPILFQEYSDTTRKLLGYYLNINCQNVADTTIFTPEHVCKKSFR